jgi:hypothetical protein
MTKRHNLAEWKRIQKVQEAAAEGRDMSLVGPPAAEFWGESAVGRGFLDDY